MLFYMVNIFLPQKFTSLWNNTRYAKGRYFLETDEELAKNFGHHLLKNCCATNVFVKIYIFFAKFGGRSKWKILNVKILSWVHHIWFLSTLRSLKIIEKTCRRNDNRHKQKAARKKLAGIFGNFFDFTWSSMCMLYFMK